MNKYFIYTGNAYPHKNLPRLISAIVALNKDRKEEIRLKIVSARSVFTERLEKEVKKQKAESYIELLGFVSDKELNLLYKNSISFVFPTLSEGFGLPPMEAINAGTLAIASNIPVLKEVYGDSVYYFDPYDTDSITTALKGVLDMPEAERIKNIEVAQKFIKRYSWLQMAKETLKVYESI